MNNGQVPTEQTGIFTHTSTMLFTMGRVLHVAVNSEIYSVGFIPQELVDSEGLKKKFACRNRGQKLGSVGRISPLHMNELHTVLF